METKQMTKSNRLLAAMAIGIIALIAAAAVFIAVRDPVEFDPGTPEGVVQAYLVAIFDDDAEAAYALLAADLQRCDVDGLMDRYDHDDDSRITLVESNIAGDRATIKVKFTATYNEGPFGYSESSYEETFRLTRSDGDWQISSAPWPYYRCPEVTP